MADLLFFDEALAQQLLIQLADKRAVREADSPLEANYIWSSCLRAVYYDFVH